MTNLDAHLLTAIRIQTRYPVTVLHKAVTAFLSAIVLVKGRPNCKTLNTQSKHIRIDCRNQLVIRIFYNKKLKTLSARQIAYFIARKRFPPEGIQIACSCGYYHCVEHSHFFRENQGCHSTVKRNHKRDYRNSSSTRTGGYSVYTYSEEKVITDPKDLPLWADLDTPTVEVKATRID